MGENHELYFRLVKIIERHDSQWPDYGEEENNAAKDALLVFYREFKKLKPSKTYCKNSTLGIHSFYLMKLIPLRQAFVKQRYRAVCNELLSLLHGNPFLQPRIYYNIIKLMDDYLGGDGDELD